MSCESPKFIQTRFIRPGGPASDMKQLLISPLILIYCMHGLAQKINLFNGKNLEGWQPLNGQAKYEVINHEIVGTSVANTPNSFLATRQVYSDFILELEFKIDDQSNSGIQLRSESRPDYQNGRVHGYQVEIDPSPRAWTGGLYDEGRRDWLYPLEYNPAAKSAFRKGEWNKVRVECIGPVLRSWVNGVPTSHVVDDMTPRGFIALQVHAANKPEEVGRQVRWRNILIQTQNLKESPLDDIFVVNLIPNSLCDQERRNGLNLLWDGKTTDGWRGANQEKFPDKGWEIKDGVIQVLPTNGGAPAPGGDIVTQKEFVAFDFQFEFKFTEGANSGVKYFVAQKEGHSGPAIGLEYQILDDAYYADAKLDEAGNHTLAALYDLVPPMKTPRGIHKTGEWNQGRIIAYPDKRVEHWLNGYKVVAYQRGSPGYDALVSQSKYAGMDNFGMAATGHILLQNHGGSVYFRNIKIKEFK